jgi:hypothetical protein
VILDQHQQLNMKQINAAIDCSYSDCHLNVTLKPKFF